MASFFLWSSCWGQWSCGLLLLGGYVYHEVHHPVAIAKFIITPDELDKMVIEIDGSPSIKVGEVSVTVKVAETTWSLV